MEIKSDKRNYRIHDNRNKDLINKSLSECGAGRSILIDNENEIIAGNGVYEQAQKLNIPIRIVETNGDELVVVKRTDLNTADLKRKRLAVFDNSASDTSKNDVHLLLQDWLPDELESMGITVPKEEIVLWEDIDAIDITNYKEPPKTMCCCPKCQHLDSVERFMKSTITEKQEGKK